MTTGTAFGPQGYQSVANLPDGIERNRMGFGIDTWVRDCTAGDENGTILDAAFFNMIIGNLRNVVKQAITDGANITITDGELDLLTQAVKFYGQDNAPVAGAGIAVNGNVVSVDVPNLKIMLA